MKQLKAYFQAPLGAAPDGMSKEDWQKFGFRISPGAAINQFLQQIKDDVLRDAEALIADPAAADRDSITRTLALLAALSDYQETYLKSLSYTSQLKQILKQK